MQGQCSQAPLVAVGCSYEIHFLRIETALSIYEVLTKCSWGIAGPMQSALLQITWNKKTHATACAGPKCAEMQPPEFCHKVLEGGPISTNSAGATTALMACLITTAECVIQ
jgi:hypothetical protein